jgi:hypothetical protein
LAASAPVPTHGKPVAASTSSAFVMASSVRSNASARANALTRPASAASDATMSAEVPMLRPLGIAGSTTSRRPARAEPAPRRVESATSAAARVFATRAASRASALRALSVSRRVTALASTRRSMSARLSPSLLAVSSSNVRVVASFA